MADFVCFPAIDCSVAGVLLCVDKGYCYYKHQICDGVTQCPDGQDEKNCHVQTDDNGEFSLIIFYSKELDWAVMVSYWSNTCHNIRPKTYDNY